MGTFSVDTIDLSGIEWSPDDSSLVIWDSPIEYKVTSFFTYNEFIILFDRETGMPSCFHCAPFCLMFLSI